MTDGTGVSPDFWRGRAVLVTGHTGFKGVWLAVLLSRLGAEVTGLALEPETDPNAFERIGLDAQMVSMIGDVRDESVVDRVMRQSAPEIVLHLAAQSLVRRSYDDPLGTYATNVMGTANVLEAARRVDDLAAVVVVTSDKCYDNQDGTRPYREGDPLGGHDPYSSSKAAAELVAASWRSSFLADRSVGVATVRAGNVIGGGDWAPDRLLPDCVRSFAADRAVEVRHPSAVRPWQHVLEPLTGYLVLAERLVDSASTFAGAWNFGPSLRDDWTVGDVVEHAANRWGDGAHWISDMGSHPHEASTLRVDASKAHDLLGWRSRLGVAEAIEWAVDWYRAVGAGADAMASTVEQIDSYASKALLSDG